MLYFKNAELAEAHHISLRTVLNWIEATKQGKLGLTLYTQGEKSYVANTARNIAIIEQLVEDRRKYRNKRSVKVVSPSPDFYELYDHQQVLDIISNLDVYHEIPRQYNYFDNGAHYWDQYANRLASEESPNTLNSTIKLIELNEVYLDQLIAGYKKVNILDIGVGNALPVRGFLQRLSKKKVLNKYVALDISTEMLNIARDNLTKWFGEDFPFEAYEMDLNYDRFGRLLAEGYLDKEADTVNIVLLLGATLSNLRSPDAALRVIHDSMGRKDIFMYTLKLDTATSRKYFDFSADPQNMIVAADDRFIFDFLNVDETLYDVEMGYDEVKKERFIRVRLRVALTIEFKFSKGKRLVDFNKGDTILLWRSIHQTALDVIHQFDRNDFYPLHTSQTDDKEYLLAIAKIKTSDLL